MWWNPRASTPARIRTSQDNIHSYYIGHNADTSPGEVLLEKTQTDLLTLDLKNDAWKTGESPEMELR